MPHLPDWKSARFSLKPFEEAPGGPVLLDQVDVELGGGLPLLRIELRLPVHVEPARAEGIGKGGDEGHVLAPAGLAAQADAVDAVLLVGDLVGRLLDEVPGRAFRHLQAGLLEQVGAVHRHRALAVERRSVERAVIGERLADGRQQIALVEVLAEIVERHQPFLLCPDRHLVVADRHHVVLAAMRGDVGRHALAQDVLLERHPLQIDVRVLLLEVVRQLLHADHVTIVHGGNGERHRVGTGRKTHGRACAEQQRLEFHRKPPTSGTTPKRAFALVMGNYSLSVAQSQAGIRCCGAAAGRTGNGAGNG